MLRCDEEGRYFKEDIEDGRLGTRDLYRHLKSEGKWRSQKEVNGTCVAHVKKW
jgi:hypothetical protein